MTDTSYARLVLVARIAAVATVGLLALRLAWMSDDALITLRTALNITHEWGPGFNVTERVQAYTHPLWFLTWVTWGGLTNQWVVGILLVSVALSTTAVGLLLWRAASLARVALATTLLVFSNAFMEFTTGGLENPLSYLLVGLLVALTCRTWGPLQAVTAGLVAAAVVLTRFDLALLIVPALALLLWSQRRSWRSLAAFVLSAGVPLLVWFAWSKWTYDAWLPNTFEAKRNVQIPQSELIVEGLRYLWVTFEHDPVSFVALGGGLLVAFAFGPGVSRAWAAGVALYLAYVVAIGGDFMAGRFVALPVYVAVFLLVLAPPLLRRRPAGTHDPALVGVVAGATLLLLASTGMGSVPTSLSGVEQPRWDVDQNLNAGVVDARGSSAAGGMTLRNWVNNLSLAYTAPDIAPLGDGSGLARSLREIDKAAGNWPDRVEGFTNPSEVGVFCGFLGVLGIATGPITHLIDSCALTDRYLAGRPFVPAEPFAWKPGHFHRDIPEGYVAAVATNDPSQLVDLAERYEVTKLWERIR